MPFNSFTYALFLPLVYLLFRLAGNRVRWAVLLAASLAFYGALDAPYLPAALTLVALTSYAAGLGLAAVRGDGARRLVFWGAVAANLLILFTLKYLPSLRELFPGATPPMGAYAAIGVSYYVFQAISYLSDVYLELEQPERHFGYFALYLAFFPKLLQGPIERAGDLLPQLKSRYAFDYQRARLGLVLFAWGLFKKIVVADRLALFVNGVYGDVHAAVPIASLLATYAYALQIYLDFSGYTDMALGSAQLFNIELTDNFNRPYLATSVADFWRRWHISFSRWILDYLFKPLQMQWRNLGNTGTACALVATFLASGIWHGARWGFVVWGGLHGLYLAVSVFYRPWQRRLHKALSLEKSRVLRLWQIFATFHLVSFAWIFFRAGSLGDAATVIGSICRLSPGVITARYLRNTIGGLITQSDLGTLILCALFMGGVSLADLRGDNFRRLFSRGYLSRWSFYVTLSLMIVMLARMADVPFLYFQF